MTVIDLVQAAHDRLHAAGVAFGHGTDNAWDEAAWLVLWRLGLALDALDDHADAAVTPVQQAAVETLVAQRIDTRQPAAYLTGVAWLQGVPFDADARALVPRSLIAEPLAEGTLDIWLGAQTLRVLDLCTGSGSLAVLAALAWPEARVLATDISAEALMLARRNVERHGLADRIELRHGDGLSAIDPRRDGGFDLILCNPPYVHREAMAALPPEFRSEPALALDGGHDGMDFVRRLLAGAARVMNDEAVLVLEIGHERAHFDAAFPRLSPVGLSTSAGDDQVLLLTREQLQ